MALRLWGLTKVFLLKRHFVYLKFLPAQVFENACVGGEVEAQAIGVECLLRFAIFAVHAADAVLAVAEQRVTEIRHACADLMGAAGEELDLQKRQLAARPERLIQRDRAAAFGHGAVIDAHGVALLVLSEKALDPALRRLDAAKGDT